MSQIQIQISYRAAQEEKLIRKKSPSRQVGVINCRRILNKTISQQRGETIESNSFRDKLKALLHCAGAKRYNFERVWAVEFGGPQDKWRAQRAARAACVKKQRRDGPPSRIFQQQIPPRPAPPAAAFRQQLTASMVVNYLNVTLYRV